MITNRIEYLLLALVNLARKREVDDGFTLSREIALEEHIPLNYMPQLMAMLTKRGWVESLRGVNGGVRLVVDPKRITIKEVTDVSGDPVAVKKCVVEGCHLGKSNCLLLPLWKEMQQKIDEVMAATTIEDLLQNTAWEKDLTHLFS